MTTQLAQQLNALKISQKDALVVPARARVSFLFDSKQAANIDDQTLFYICKAGVKQLKDSRTIDLSSFENDIIDEKSLSFYRGTETKDTLSAIDERLDTLLKAISPHLLEQASLKVIEYLLRIYDVHVYHKETLIQAFIPLFETLYFLRITQCLNLKDDQTWGWLYQFAYEGVSIDKTTLVKCIARQNGLVFCKLANFCYIVKGDLHIKFFGVFLTEVLKANTQEGLMFGVLPFISQGLKQCESKDLRVSCLLALGQLACRRTLTKEYTAAFVRQILLMITAKDRLEFDEDQKVKGLTTLMFFAQYQQVKLDKKDISYLLKIPKLNKMLELLTKQFDTSSLALVVLESSYENEISTQETEKLLYSMLNLKTVFLLTQSLCNRVAAETELKTVTTRQQLEMVKILAPEQFQQSVVYILKQTFDQNQKERILKLLQNSDQGNLIVTYGEKEYSILSALCSQKQITREAALKSLNEKGFAEVLSKKEASLVSMVLLQIISGSAVVESQFLQIASALKLVSLLTDADFEVLLNVYEKICAKEITYSRSTEAFCVDILCKMQVQNAQNQKVQAWLAFQHKVTLWNGNPYIDIGTNKKAKDPIEYFVQKTLESTQKYLPLLLGVLSQSNSFVDFSMAAKILKKLGIAVQKDLLLSTVQNQLFCPLLSAMNKQKFRNAAEVLNAILDGIVPDQISCQSKLVNKLLGASLVQKQYWGQQFDLVQLHKKMSQDVSKFAEILVNMALTSKSKLKRMFAIQVIVCFHQKGSHQFQLNSQLSYKIMIGAVLILLNDSDKQIREGALKLAEVMLETQKQAQKDVGLAVIEVFADTDKPQSVQKRPNKLTPMKSKTVSSLLEDLLAAKSDLILDQGQLRLVLSKHQKLDVYEEILRSLLDYPTSQLKQKLIQVLTLPLKHAVIFCMNLNQALPKLFVQIQKSPEKNIGLLQALGALITHLQESTQDSKKEVFTSITLPYLRFITENPFNDSLIFDCFKDSVIPVIKEVEQKSLVEVFKLYIRSKPQQKLKLLFSQSVADTYKGDDLALCLIDQYDLELVLETIISLAPLQSAKLFTKTTETLKHLVQKFEENSDVAYQIELCCQLAKQSAPTKSDRTAQVVSEILKSANKVWEITKRMISFGLKQESDTRSDPFNEFMADGRVDDSDDDMNAENEIDLLPFLQVFTSILNLLTPLEQKESLGQIDKTTSLLSEMADYLELVCKTKSAAASTQSGIKSQLYYLYQSLVLRTAQRPAEGRPYSQLITKYLSCSVNLIEHGGMVKLVGEGNLILNTVKSLPDYCALISFTFIWLASQSKLDLDSQGRIIVGIEVGTALYLAQETLIWSIDLHQDISPLRDLLFNIHQVQISKDKFKVDEQTEQLYGQNTKEFQWFSQCSTILEKKDSKSLRKFVYLACSILNQWLAKTPQFIQRTASIAGVEQPNQEVQEQLLHLVLSSYLLKDQVTVLLQSESSDSLTRLQNCVNTLQSTLNEMMSLQIHIKIVMEILDMAQQTLKQNTLCLLLDKLATFPSGWLAKSSKGLHSTFENLVEKCLVLLDNGNNTESLTQLLLTVVSRTASPSLPRLMQIRSVEITMKNHRGSLQLQTQTILTEMNLMETYSFQMLDYFHLYLKHTLDGFLVRKDQPFIDTYKHALLKSLVCISQVFLKFLSADQLEQVISLSISAAADQVIISRSGDPVETILESIATEAPQHRKLIMQATMNSYSLLTNHAKSSQFKTIAVRYFQQLLLPVIRRLPQSYISENHEKFVIFFKQMFLLPQKAESSAHLIVECFNAFTLKLNEETLRPIIVQLAKWTAKEPKRRLVFFQILCGCLETLREFFVPMIKVYFEQAFTCLTECQTDLDVSKQGKRTHKGAQPDETLVLLKQVCRLIELNYKFDTGSFLQNDTFETLCDPIADLFDLTVVPQFDQFVESYLKPLVLEMDERSNDDSMWLKLNYTLLMKTRSEQWQTRLAVLSIIEHMFDKMRERYLVILNDTIPFISELLEDEEERVEQAAKRIVLRIEQLTGESINEYLK